MDLPTEQADSIEQTGEPEPRTEIYDLGDEIEFGGWYWVDNIKLDSCGDEEPTTHLGCVTHIGSNYAKLEIVVPDSGRGCTVRVHFDDFWSRCEPVDDPQSIIN